MNINNLRIVPIDDLKFKKRKDELPSNLIDRITLVHYVFQKYLSPTLERTIENFKYDDDPESEIIVWEHMASMVVTLENDKKWPKKKMSAAVKLIVQCSVGVIEDNTLDKIDTQTIILMWRDRRPR